MRHALLLGLGTPKGTAGKAARLAVPRVARARQRVRKQVQRHRVHAGVAAGGATGVIVAENPRTSVPNPSTISHHISPLLFLSPRRRHTTVLAALASLLAAVVGAWAVGCPTSSPQLLERSSIHLPRGAP